MLNNNKLVQQLETAIVIVLCVLIFSLPVSIAMVESLSGLALFLFFIKKAVESNTQVRLTGLNGGYWHIWLGKVFEPKTFLHWPLYILTGVIFLSVLFSQYRVISLIAFIAKTLQGVALVLVITDNIKKRWHLVAFISALVAISVLVALSAIYQYVDGVDFLRGNILFGGRSAACFRHPNDLGAFLVLPLMTCFGLLLVIKRPWFKYVIIAVIGLVAAALLFTFSRSSWLGFLCAMGMFILLKPRFWKLAIILIGVFAFIFVPLLASKRQMGLVTDSVYGLTQADENNKDTSQIHPMDPAYTLRSRHTVIEDVLSIIRRFGGDGRAEYWVKALNIIDSAPVLGTGLNTYAKVEVRYPAFWGGGYPHNCYLQMTAETGLLGLMAFLWFIGTFFIRSIKACKRMKDDQMKVFILSLVSGVAGFLVQSFFDTTLYSVQLGNFIWIMIGFVVAAIYVEKLNPKAGN